MLTLARKAGACLTLAKPFEVEDLLAVVSKALGPAETSAKATVLLVGRRGR